jgi:hypothetical protein
MQRRVINGDAAKASRPKRISPGKGIGSMSDVLGDIKL